METRKDVRLFFSILLWNLLPSVYFLIRAHFIAVSGSNINIMGQMEWFDLIDEILTTALTVPLYYILKDGKTDAAQNKKIIGTAWFIYAAFSMLIALRIGTITKFMNAENAKAYLLLQMIAMTAGFMLTLMVILFTLHGMSRLFYGLTVLKLVMLATFDAVLMPRFTEYGAAYSDITVNIILAAMAVILAYKTGLLMNGKGGSCKSLYKDWAKIGLPAGLQIYLDNWIYAVLVVRIVNAASDAGPYWMANNFIWGWLLVPVAALAEIIKKNKAEKLTARNALLPSAVIGGIWLVTIPAWQWFIGNGMSMDADTVLPIVMTALPFYFVYIACSAIDAWFISCGKTWCTAVISAVVNIGYYGSVYLISFRRAEEIGLPFIIKMFGWGMVVHLAAAAVLYAGIQIKQRKQMELRQKTV